MKNTCVSCVFHVLGVVGRGGGGQVREGDEGRGRGAAEHEKHVRLVCFLCPGGGDCRRSALAQKIVPLWARFSCWGRGLGYESHRTRKTRACCVFFMFGGVVGR